MFSRKQLSLQRVLYSSSEGPKSQVKFDKIEIVPAQVGWRLIQFSHRIVAGNLHNTLIKLSAKEHREDFKEVEQRSKKESQEPCVKKIVKLNSLLKEF